MTDTRKTIPASALFARWREDPDYRSAYAEADAEFSVARAMIAARAQANLTQAELARRMGTTQSAIARMEGGRFKPSHSTLEKYARATGTRLRVSFEVIGADAA